MRWSFEHASRAPRIGLVVGLLLTLLGGGAACSATAPRLAPGLPPTPSSISVAEPGGNAADPEEAALERLAHARWGRRNDKDDQLHVPLLDWRHWKRVRFWSVEHFVGFRYGDDHHAVAIVVLLDADEAGGDSRTCMRNFEARARRQLRGFDFDFDFRPAVTREGTWKGKEIVVRAMDGRVDFALGRHEFSAAWAAYSAYPDACLVYGIAVPWGEHEALAKRVRDRFFEEGFERLRPKTATRPTRS